MHFFYVLFRIYDQKHVKQSTQLRVSASVILPLARSQIIFRMLLYLTSEITSLQSWGGNGPITSLVN